MAFEYTVWARSPSTQQEVREFNLSSLQNIPYTDERLANQAAVTFANRMSQQRYMHIADWQPLVKNEDVGIHTFVNAMNNR